MQPAPTLMPSRFRRLRLLVHTRKIVAVTLPLGAGIGLFVALALKGLNVFEPWISRVGGRSHLTLFLPGLGLVLTTLWLTFSRLGASSLSKDLELARRDPYAAFPFRGVLGKVTACALTIGFGGSAGVEGPGKWLGAALGIQFHRLLRAASTRWAAWRHLLASPSVMARSGAAAALAAVFRAPLSGALMAAEHHGHLASEALSPCLVAAASGYVAFSACLGHAPLLPLSRPYALEGRDLGWALLLGLCCGLAATLFLWLKDRLEQAMRALPLPVRGLIAGAGLILLALPSHFFWRDLAVTQGGGLELVHHLLVDPQSLPQAAFCFLGLKLAATALTFAGGGVGGIWLPSIAMGAALGAGFDALLGTGQPGYMILVGASALAGATHRTLLVPCVFLAETTGRAALVVPALVGTTVAYLLVREHSIPKGKP